MMADAEQVEIKAEEISYSKDKRLLTISFNTGEEYELDAEFLRVESPSAEVRGHAPHQRKWVGGKRGVGITAIEPIGNYAVRLTFDDGHDTGLYSWDSLADIGRDRDAIWQAYLDKIAELGISRDG